MKESTDLVRFERTLKAVANRRRLAIVRFLKTCNSATVSEIADAIGLSFKATSKHLQLLFSVGILEREQKSTLIFYSLSLTPGRVLETVIKVV